jgi:hypothetical protein
MTEIIITEKNTGDMPEQYRYNEEDYNLSDMVLIKKIKLYFQYCFSLRILYRISSFMKQCSITIYHFWAANQDDELKDNIFLRSFHQKISNIQLARETKFNFMIIGFIGIFLFFMSFLFDSSSLLVYVEQSEDARPTAKVDPKEKFSFAFSSVSIPGKYVVPSKKSVLKKETITTNNDLPLITDLKKQGLSLPVDVSETINLDSVTKTTFMDTNAAIDQVIFVEEIVTKVNVKTDIVTDFDTNAIDSNIETTFIDSSNNGLDSVVKNPDITSVEKKDYTPVNVSNVKNSNKRIFFRRISSGRSVRRN